MWQCFFRKYLLNDTVSCCKHHCVMLDFHHNLQITDRTILDKQVVHETLYKLWKDEYIDSEVCCIDRTQHFFLRQAFYFIFLRFCPFTLESLHQNIFYGRLTMYLLQRLQSLSHFNVVKQVNWHVILQHKSGLWTVLKPFLNSSPWIFAYVSCGQILWNRMSGLEWRKIWLSTLGVLYIPEPDKWHYHP